MRIESDLQHDIGAEHRIRFDDGAIAALAARQHGVVARGQLLQLGLRRGGIRRRLAAGRVHRVHQGVYAVGHHVLSREGRWLAAVLAAGPGAVLSHRSAGALWGIRDTARTSVEVIAAQERRRPGIDSRRIALPVDEVMTHHGIPVTTPIRTLLDLAEVLPFHDLERAVHETEFRRLTSPLSLGAMLTRHHGRRGTAALRQILDSGNLGTTITRSELEIRFLAFLDAHAIERPLVNQRIGPYTVDGLYADQRLVVELDGRGAHDTTRAFEEDRRRDRDLVARSYRVIRITYRQLEADARTIAAQLRALTTR